MTDEDKINDRSTYDSMKKIIENNNVELVLRFTNTETKKITEYSISKDPMEIFAMQVTKFGLIMLKHFCKVTDEMRNKKKGEVECPTK